ncbi:MAG: glycosyltransferase family 9 protein [bacterium]
MNVLLINLARMGDLVQITSVSQGLKEELGARVTLLAPSRYAEFAQRLAGVDEVFSIDDTNLSQNSAFESSAIYADPLLRQCVATLNSRSFNLVINLTHDELSTALAVAVGARTIRGRFGQPGYIQVRGDAFRYFYAILEHREMNGINLCDIYRIGAGIKTGHRPVSMTLLPEDLVAVRRRIGATARPTILLHPGANHPHRRWPAESYGKLASLLRSEGAEVLVLAGPGENELASAVERASQGTARVIPGAVPAELLPALMSQADLVITNDTGPLHIAAAVGTPTLSLFLAMARPQDTGPYAPGQLIFETLENCHPCPEHHTCDSVVCGQSIPVEAVFAAARVRLNGAMPTSMDFQAYGGRYRVMVTQWDANGMLALHEIHQSAPKPEGIDSSETWTPFWLALFDGQLPTQDQLRLIQGMMGIDDQRALLAVATLCEGILARLNGEDLRDGNGNLLSVSILEDIALQEENRSNSVKPILLPFRLEREALYARGVDVVRREAKSRFTRWIRALTALSPDAVREEVAA